MRWIRTVRAYARIENGELRGVRVICFVKEPVICYIPCKKRIELSVLRRTGKRSVQTTKRMLGPGA